MAATPRGTGDGRRADTEAPLRFGVIGCGAHARGTHLIHLAGNPRTRLAVCCDPSASIRETCRERFAPDWTSDDWQATVAADDVDAICLATTEQLRHPVIAAAAAHGKPVYVEKPLANTLEEMYAIQRTVHRAGTPLCVGHNRRSSPAMVEAHAIFSRHMESPASPPWRWSRRARGLPPLAEDGVPSMSVRINDDWYSWKPWALDERQAPHGPMLFEMTHFTDLCNWFLGPDVEEVTAVETSMLHHAVIVRYASGALATITMSGNGSFDYPKELCEIMGQGGVVVVDHMLEIRTGGIPGAPARKTFPESGPPREGTDAPGGLLDWLRRRRAAGERAGGDPATAERGTPQPDKGHARQIDRFAREIRGEGGVVCGVNDAVLATRVAFAAIQSSRERRPVALSEL